MAAIHIGVTAAEPAGGGVDKAGVVQLTELGAYIIAVKLAPTLVEDSPVADAGVVFQLVHCGFHSFEEHFAGRCVPMKPAVVQLLDADGGQGCVTQEIVVAVVDHILKDDHAQLVTLIIKFLRLDFDMLAQRIEAEFFHSKDVVSIALRFCGGEDAVGPVALIQKPMEKIERTLSA